MAQTGPMRVPVLVLVFPGFGAAWAPGRAQDAPAVDEALVERLIEACDERDADALLGEHLTALGLAMPASGLDRNLGLAVDGALDPANRPAKAGEAKVWSSADGRALVGCRVNA